MQEEINNRLGEHSTCGLRGLVWKLLLNVKNIEHEKYIGLVQKGKPKNETYQKIRKDILHFILLLSILLSQHTLLPILINTKYNNEKYDDHYIINNIPILSTILITYTIIIINNNH